jgi:methylmalonyl-CoA mutase
VAAPTDRLELAAEFPAASEDEWRSLVAGVLAKSGRETDDPIAALTRTSYDGIAVRPLYDGPADRAAPVVARRAWDVRAHCGDPDPARARAALLTDLESGAT